MNTTTSIKNMFAAVTISLLFVAITPLLASAQSAVTITSLSPSSATVGGNAYTLTVNGTGFANGATVNLNGLPITTSYISPEQLFASIPSSDLESAQSYSVSVTNPGNYTTNAMTLTVYPSTPVITSISPSSGGLGNGDTTVIVNGYGFLSGATVYLNGNTLSTTYISPVQLSATIPSSYFNSIGNYSLTVANPGIATSSPVTFTVSGASSSPSINSISPSVILTGSGGGAITVVGSGFTNGSMVELNGVILPTTYISPIELFASVPTSSDVYAANDSVTVVNPGVGTSNSIAFVVSGTTPTLPDTGFGPSAQGTSFGLYILAFAAIATSLVAGIYLWTKMTPVAKS